MTARIGALWLYPIKGCRGFSVPSATLASTGLEVDGIGDREWVVIDNQGEFLSQRELPKMGQIETRLTGVSLRLKAPGMLQLDVPFESEGDIIKVRVWNDEVAAVTQGEIADAWFSQFLGLQCRLMRFDPEASRISNSKYTGTLTARYKFADAFALLVCSAASLSELNGRLTAKGHAAITIERFRPNIVLDGVDAYEEDYAEHFTIGSAKVRVVKPCVRCAVPNVDPPSGEAGFEPGDTLAVYRNDARAGGVTFGANAIVELGAGARLATGDPVEVSLRF
ncbi:MAG TPA: MOSC N-terminal beta barrel domain-containing protein [Steroidobacteraceae bacterium]|nr:MOSC N-terminal beta barrel domain-containing protein [Steroidobacteraceae bacterium]